jgi:ElaA protein
MEIKFKAFKDLSTNELYALLQLRSEVFVLEQNCIYQDIDSKDQRAIHLLGFIGDTLVGYLRIFKKGEYFDQVSIGRVIVKEGYRSQGYGHILLKKALDFIVNEWEEDQVKVSAQTYLKSFYESHGFRQKGEEYLEDDIPHIAMYLE